MNAGKAVTRFVSRSTDDPKLTHIIQRPAALLITVALYFLLGILSVTVKAQQIIPPLPPLSENALVLVPGTPIQLMLTLNSSKAPPRYILLALHGDTISLNAKRLSGDGELVLKLSASNGTPLDQVQPNDLAGRITNLQTSVKTDDWYWLDAFLDPNSGGTSGTFEVRLTGTSPYLMTLAPSQFPLTVSAPLRLNDLFTLTPGPTFTPTLRPSITMTPSLTLTPSLTPSLTLTATASPTVTPSLTWTPSEIPSDTPALSDTPVPTVPDTKVAIAPTSIQCSGAPPPHLQAGMQAQISPGNPNRLRTSSGLNSTLITEIPGGSVITILAGPVCKDGYAWWRVNFNGTEGWTADGKGNDYWIVPSGSVSSSGSTNSNPVASCTYQGLFVREWNTNQSDLGCPKSSLVSTLGTSQPFDGGVMVWRQDTHQVYVILNDGRWNVYVEHWTNDNQLTCSGPYISRGFGDAYCTHPEVQVVLGGAHSSERTGSRIVIQSFDGGVILNIAQVGTEVLKNSAVSAF